MPNFVVLMSFTPFNPPAALSDVISSCYTVDSGSDQAFRSFTTVADGLPGLMLRSPGGADLIDSEHGPMKDAFLYGQATTCRTLTAQGPLKAVGIFFRPHALHTLFGLHADRLTDLCLDLRLTGDGERVVKALEPVASSEQRVQVLMDHLAHLADARRELRDTEVIRATDLIMDAHGDIVVSAVAKEVGLGERTFERRFKSVVGLTPRLFARIRRFQRTLHLLRAGDYNKLSDIAYAADYADQSHYIRSFKEFTGISPLEFRRDGNEVIENFVELPPE